MGRGSNPVSVSRKENALPGLPTKLGIVEWGKKKERVWKGSGRCWGANTQNLGQNIMGTVSI